MIHCIIGPTASGKTTFSINLAKKLNCEVINTDAYSIYKDLDIVSAKPTIEEMGDVKHYFISHFDVNEQVDVSLFQKLAREVIDQAILDGKDIILVGGSNLYTNAILFNYEFENQVSYDYDKYEHLSLEEIKEICLKVDPDYLKVAQDNKRRIIKAILYFETYNTKFSKKENKANQLFYPDTTFYYMSLSREKLYENINKRVELMFEQGLKEEYNYCKEKYGIESNAFKAIGFNEFSIYENEQLIQEKIAQNTRRLAKRQIS